MSISQRQMGTSVSLPSAESSQPEHFPLPAIRSRPPPTARTPATTTKAKIRSEPDKCALILFPLPPRRSPSQKRTRRRGPSMSGTSIDCFPKFLTAKSIGTNGLFVVPRVRMLIKSLRRSDIQGYGSPTYSASGRQPHTKAF